jgi:hypothetical protein
MVPQASASAAARPKVSKWLVDAVTNAFAAL